ncbi:hyaluronan-binding protein 2 [Poecilia reticulata]|uniref:hyaluronan-binding protein 2 n=1 Tax=Poecilia reticulata TaxID=8081 RepID=UPI0007E960D8|nr:PREDICTED: hyaluronan-binding protein 2 [Poecilia reticulata]
MKLKLLLIFLFLAVLLIPTESKPKDKHKDKHKDKPRGHGREKKKQTFEDIIEDIVFKESSDDDDEDHPFLDWLHDLQDLDGKCTPNPCLNNGVCKQKGRRGYKCDCPEPFRGRRCEKGPKVCRRGVCGRGECVLTSTAPFYECKCKYPFQPPDCKRYSVCERNPCRNGGQCVRDGNDFDCQCPEGFSGRFCRVGPNDCYVDDGESYRGNVSETDDGFECLYWNSHFILENGIDPFNSFEDDDGLGPHNFCRNPDGEPKPWCFFRRGLRLFWDYCDVNKCPKPTGGPKPPTGDPPTPTGGPQTPTSGPQTPTSGPKPPTVQPPPTPSEAAKTTKEPIGSPVVPSPSPAPKQFETCGVAQPKKILTRIFGGLKVSPGAIPWQVSVQQKPKNSNMKYSHVCGGVLIESCWVLTAGHCVEQNKDMQVVMGTLSLDTHDPAAQVIQVENAIVHENYRETSEAVYNDIALLRLRGTNGVCANETQFVKTACLPSGQISDGTECTISGWGATEDSNYGSNHLLEANVLLISQTKCSEPAIYGNVLNNGMFCAGHLQGGVDSCQGDSGGPLTCKQNNTSVVYGVVSWGDQCGKKNKPGVYSRVSNFLDWINSKTQGPA